MDHNTTGTSCLGPLSGLNAQKSLYEQSIAALSDPGDTTLYLVSRPETSSLREAERSRLELAALGIANQKLLLNALFVASDPDDAAAAALQRRGTLAVENMPPGLAALRRMEFPLLARAPMGIDGLRGVFAGNSSHTAPSVSSHFEPGPSLSMLIDDLERAKHGVIMTMGKGGVGKTTVAAAIAIELAARGHAVHLSTTDPAAHIAATVGGDSIPNLKVSRIDPAVETKQYSAAVLAKAAPLMDADGIALLAEDLRSPCTEEIAVFTAFARAVADGKDRFVVLDTAPTGHTILLLDAAEAYHRDVTRTLSDAPESVLQLLPRLRDPKFTHVLLVTLPEATPVHEAAHLQEDLERAGISPWAWIVNQSFAGCGFRDPILKERGAREEPFIAEVRDRLATRIAIISWAPEAPTGPERLRALASGSLVTA